MNKNLNIIKDTKNVISMNTKKIYTQFVDFVDSNFLKFQNQTIDHDQFYSISVDMDQIKKEQIQLQCFENKLLLTVQQKNDLQLEESDVSKFKKLKTYHQVFQFDDPVDTLSVTASLYKDSLEIYLPKLLKPRDIDIIESEETTPRASKNNYYSDDWSSYPGSHVSKM